jgi:hypothetical protein
VSRPQQFIVVRFAYSPLSWQRVVGRGNPQDIDVENATSESFYVEFATARAFNEALGRLQGIDAWEAMSWASGIELSVQEYTKGSALPLLPVATYRPAS